MYLACTAVEMLCTIVDSLLVKVLVDLAGYKMVYRNVRYKVQ